MRMTPIASALLQSVGYDLETKRLVIRFHNGSVSEYASVPPLVYAELMNADVPEVYLNSNIQNHYPCNHLLKMTPVASTSISSIGYDPRQKILYIRFRNGYTYEYQGVPASLYAELMNSYSIGAFLNQHVRRKFPFQRIWTERSRVALPSA
jgi:hypothetical protein